MTSLKFSADEKRYEVDLAVSIEILFSSDENGFARLGLKELKRICKTFTSRVALDAVDARHQLVVVEELVGQLQQEEMPEWGQG